MIIFIKNDYEDSNLKSQLRNSVPSKFVAVAEILVAPNTKVTLTVLSSTLWNGLPISIESSPNCST